jgi:hypothetical protein
MQQVPTPLPTPPPRGAARETPMQTHTQRTPSTPLEPPPRNSSQRLTTPLDALAEISQVLVEKTSQLAAKERVRAMASCRCGTCLSLTLCVSCRNSALCVCGWRLRSSLRDAS